MRGQSAWIRVKLLLVTQNNHKRREFARLLQGHEVEALPAGFQLPPEDGETFEANAWGKARAAAGLALELGAIAFADDSGIEAAALDGAPGVRSARYAGEQASDEENLEKLLKEAPEGSGLRYVCALTAIDPETGDEVIFHGYCSGTLTYERRGGRGFGYDPVFVPDEQPARGAGGLGGGDGAFAGGDGADGDDTDADDAPRPLTMAELTDAEKDEISHRGRALQQLLAWLESL